MKAATVRERHIVSIEDIPTPQGGPGEMVVQASYCGICGSDVRVLAERHLSLGLVRGHGFCGMIFEIRLGVEGWTIGDRVTDTPMSACGNRYNVCVDRGVIAPRPG